MVHAIDGFYPYNFLDPSTGSGKVAGYCFGILAASIVIFGVIWGLIWFRGWAARRSGLDYDRGERKRRSMSGAFEPGSEAIEMK